MPDTFYVEIQGLDEARRRLNRLSERVGDLSPLMNELTGVLEDEAQEAFAQEADPATGDKWKRLTTDYVKHGRGGDEHPILQRSGDLAKLQTDFGDDFAQIGSNEPYAAIHQLGGRPGMAPGPAAIPARPYLGVSRAGLGEILRRIDDYLSKF